MEGERMGHGGGCVLNLLVSRGEGVAPTLSVKYTRYAAAGGPFQSKPFL